MGLAQNLIPGIGMIMGQQQMRRANREARRAAREQQAHIAQVRGEAQQEQARVNAERSQAQQRLAAGIARANRARRRGGIFGDAQSGQQPLQATLG